MKKFLQNFSFFVIDVFLLISIFFISKIIALHLFNLEITISYTLKKFLFIIAIILLIFIYEKIYTLRYDFWQETYKIIKSIFLSFFIVFTLITFQKNIYFSTAFIIIYFLLTVILVPFSKRLIKKIFFQLPFFQRRVLIIGKESQVNILKNEFSKNWYLGLKASKEKYDIIIISSKSYELKNINEKIEKYLNNNSEVYIIPYITDINFANSNILEYSNIRCNTIQIQNKLLIKRNIWIKNIFDYMLALLILPIFFFLHIFIAIAIKFDSRGSIFFKQKRLGKDGKIFYCYKYRTMYKDSKKILQNYLKKYPEEIEYYKKYHKYKNDPRITKFGKFLRTTSLDELAQIINILKNEMSIVGPRPYMLKELKKLGNHKNFILKVKPGITGLWQVSGRNNLTFEQRIKLEVWYIKNWSLWADFIILIKTIKVVFFKIGAK